MKRLMTVCALMIAVGAGYLFGQARISVNSNVATVNIQGSNPAKRLTVVSVHYNNFDVPCIIVDTTNALNQPFGAGISCGWTREATLMLGQK